jgi:hypothetical protein
MATILAAGAGIALFDWMSSKGQSLTITDNITTSMYVNAVLESKTDCITRQQGSQTVTIKPGTEYPPAAKLVSSTSSCLACENALETIVVDRNLLETEAVKKSNGVYVPQSASSSMSTAMLGGIGPSGADTQHKKGGIGACDLMCNDIVSSGLMQSQVFVSESLCQVSTVSTSDINQSINGSINAYIKNQQDIMGQLEGAFTTNTQSITNSISSSMAESVTTSFVQKLKNESFSVQTIKIGSQEGTRFDGAHSIYVEGVDQKFTAKSIAKLTVNNQVNNSLRQSADYSISQTILNKNDTIGDLSKDFLGIISTMADLMETITGQMLAILGSILAILVLVIGAAYEFNPTIKNDIDNRLTSVIEGKPQGSSTAFQLA